MYQRFMPDLLPEEPIKKCSEQRTLSLLPLTLLPNTILFTERHFVCHSPITMDTKQVAVETTSLRESAKRKC